MRKTLIAILILTILLSGCNFPLAGEFSPTVIPISDLLINQQSKYPVTPTPFQPIPPTPTPGPPITTGDPGDSTPVGIPVESSPTSPPLLLKPEGQVNILLLGSDWREGSGYRTDVILLVALNKTAGTATLLSFPRDLYVEIPGIGMSRINAAHPYGGFDLTAATFKNNFGIDIDYYMITNFYGFISIVDTLGGINVNAARALNDLCILPQAVNDYCYIPAGINHMNGRTALWYVRARQASSDFDRTRRAQEVLVAIFQKAMSLDALSRGTELYNLFQSSVETNIPVGAVLELLPLGSKILSDPTLIRRFAIGSEHVSNYIVPGTGAMVLIPNASLVTEVIRQALAQ
jgi:LCP family protein required for cell wall assembly